MKIKTLAGIAGLALVLAACGDDGTAGSDGSAVESVEQSDGAAPTTTEPETPATTEPDTTAPATTEPTTTEPTTTEPDESSTPQAIISLSPTATEMLYAIGAGDQVLAVDDFSNFPAEAAEKMSGLSGFEPNVEAIAGLEPDLVVTDGTNPALLDQLDTLEIPRWEGPAASSFDDVYTQIEQLGAATGHVAEAAQLVAEMQQDVAEVKAGLPELETPLTYYHELDATFFSVTSDTFIGAVYAEIGLVNIADAVGEGNPYPQLNAEYIIDENPDLIFLACTKYCGETAETLAARPGWGSLDAVTGGGVIEMDDDIASRWGPRIVDHLRAAGEGVAVVADSVTAG
ncbi:MAG: ABC transporter substrate-binding protein [Ilumatobacteraceae bacterium]|nr:ABC transporter substrate-binding protein [Ilumatobacteraceae bacterium]